MTANSKAEILRICVYDLWYENMYKYTDMYKCSYKYKKFEKSKLIEMRL